MKFLVYNKFIIFLKLEINKKYFIDFFNFDKKPTIESNFQNKFDIFIISNPIIFIVNQRLR
jgi:hypothetical protein